MQEILERATVGNTGQYLPRWRVGVPSERGVHPGAATLPLPREVLTCYLLQVRAAREFDEGQARAADDYLVGAYGGGRFVAVAAGGGDDVVLVYAVAADADAADQLAVLVERDAARKDLDAV